MAATARGHIEQLSSHTKRIACMHKSGSQHRTNIQLLTNLARISHLSFILGDY